MADHPNAALYRDLDRHLQGGDLSSFGNFLADDVIWHEIGSDEPLRGKDAVVARWTSGELASYQFEGRLHDVVANDDHTIALQENTVSRDGRALTYRTAEILHVRDGKITERWAFSDDTAAINKFFG